MKIEGTINSILSKIDKHGELIGAGATAWNKREQLLSEIQKISRGHIHFPDAMALIQNIPNEIPFQQGVAAAIGGLVLQSLNVNPLLNRVGSVAQKIGTGMALMLIIENTLGYATNPGYPPGTGAVAPSTGARGYGY